MELKKIKYKNQELSFTLKEEEINGMSGTHLEELIECICLNSKNKKVSVVPEWIDDTIHEATIEEYITEYMKAQEIYPKNLSKKIKDSLKIVGLDESYLERNIYSFSSSEQKRIQIAQVLLQNPDIMILKEPLKVLDLKQRKKIMMVLKRIKDQYQKIIVLVSEDSETLLKEASHLVVFKNENIIVNTNTIKAFQKVEELKKHKVEIPQIIEMTYLARKNKNIKIDYFNDIRDIIKDIYKHV